MRRPPVPNIEIARRNRLLFRGAAAILAMLSQVAASQTSSIPRAVHPSTDQPSVESICSTETKDAAKAALRLVCQKERPAYTESVSPPTIVIGFVGGFASPQDLRHPEVLFAALLREQYGPMLHARIFSNHDRNGALHYVLGLLDTNQDGVLSDEEKKNARIIIYGHSWGASETVAFAKTLQHYSIPVLLTVQLDTVGKWGQQPSRIPSNVETAINFFQSEGFLRGRPEIFAADESRTEIIGNFRFTYIDKPINCDNYPLLARTFNKPHHEVENDPGVWNQIALLIDSKMARSIDASRLSANTSKIDNESIPPGTFQHSGQPTTTNPRVLKPARVSDGLAR